MIPDNLAYLVATGAAASGSTTLVINVGAGGGHTVLPGERIVVSGGGGTGIPTGVTDTQGNTYTAVQSNATSPAAWQFVAVAGTHGLRTDGQGAAAPGGSPDQITLTYSGTGSAKQAVVFAVAGPYTGCIGAAGAVDTTANATAVGTTAAPSITSGTLAGAPTGELVVVTLTNANTSGAPTWGPNLLPLGTAQTGTGSFCSAAVWVPNFPNIANTHAGSTTAITATATLATAGAWTMAITAIKPGSNTVKSFVGATIFHPAYPLQPNPSSPPGQGDVNATLYFDQITGTAAGANGRKTYHTTGLWAADVTHPRPWGTYIVNGMYQLLCMKPIPAIGGGITSEKTNMASFLALMKNYVCQINTVASPAGGIGSILWQEPNLGGKGGGFGDGSSTKQGAGSTPYWTPPAGPSNPPPTEAQAAANYHDYAQYYSPISFAAGLPVFYDPVVSSPSTGVDWCPGRRWLSAYVWDYYYHADYASPTGVGKGDDQTQFLAQCSAMVPQPAIGICEIGPNDSHPPNNTPADIYYPGFVPWIKNIVVAPILAYVAAGGYMAPSTGWFEDQQGVGNLNPGPPENTPAVIKQGWVYLYNQIQAASAGPPTISTTSPLPDAAVGKPYTGVSLVAKGGTPGFTWSISSGALPAGLSLAADGTITGTPTQAVTRTPTFKVTDAAAATATAVLSITVGASVLTIPAQTFPGGTTGTTYAAQAVAQNGTGTYTWTVSAGALPAGLALTSAGAIGGTPTTAGTASFTLKVTDAASATATRAFTITITAAGALQLITTAFPNAPAGQPYQAALVAAGGTGTGYTWQVTAGQLPPGLTLNALGSISGVPVAASLGAVAYAFTLQVTDSGAHTASAVVSITVTVTVPAPISHGPWRFLYCNPQPDGGAQGEVVQAAQRTLILRTEVGNNHEADLVIDGRGLPAGSTDEAVTDIQVMFGAQTMFCGRIVPTQDVLDSAQHVTTLTALDYREVLRRKYLLQTDPPSGSGANLAWTDVEQAKICWEMITSAQARTNGNLGIARGVGQNTGTTRKYTATAGDYVSDDIDQIAQMTSGFEWDISPHGPSDLRLDVFSPWRGADQGIVLEYGDARIASITRVVDPTQFGNAVYVTGNTGLTPHIQDASDMATRPEGRWETVIGTSLKTQSSLDQFGSAQLAQLQVLTPAYTVVFYPGAWDGPGFLWLGDYVTVRIQSGRLNVNDRLRVMEMQFDVDPNNVETLTATIGVIPLRDRKVISQIRRSLRYLNTR